ncbi:MAG TPA: Hsp70 family protein [Prosthecochloris aestuarii]|uniref:Hsp70 family protein n=1 Tax=Prosthecochloris aestuarii TaxID=1102 RepID=A0A831SLL6_PROAE|nr:Hsp70 family protein [Prosthecochloris aestuarii]
MTLAIDFGTSNTVIARWNETSSETEIPFLETLTKTCSIPDSGTAKFIPSLIHIAPDGNRLIGARVESAGLVSHPATFRWLKMDLLRSGGANRSRRINGTIIYPRAAAAELVDNLLMFARGHYGNTDHDVVMTVPVEAYDHYLNWMEETAMKRFSGSVRLIDEATACILGYTSSLGERTCHAIIDFGGGTLDVSIVRTSPETATTGTCRVLGRAGEEIGGMMVDNWLLEYITDRDSICNDRIAGIGTTMLKAVEDAKISISNGKPEASVSVYDDLTQQLLSTVITSSEVQHVLEQKRQPGNYSLYQLLTRTIDRALEDARERAGLKKHELESVFLTGGSSMLPGIRQRIREYFPDCSVYSNNPFEAIARGACRFAGMPLDQALTHDYCLQSWNREQKKFEMVPVVPKGTAYPVHEPVTSKYIKAAGRQQQVLGLVIFERSVMQRPSIRFVHGAEGLEPVRDQSGKETQTKALNPLDNDFIHADPPCNPEERRFIAGFGVDEQRRLTIWLKDTLEGNRSFIRLRDNTRLPLPVANLPVVKL